MTYISLRLINMNELIKGFGVVPAKSYTPSVPQSRMDPRLAVSQGGYNNIIAVDYSNHKAIVVGTKYSIEVVHRMVHK